MCITVIRQERTPIIVQQSVTIGKSSLPHVSMEIGSCLSDSVYYRDWLARGMNLTSESVIKYKIIEISPLLSGDNLVG